jgi:hypothetical protein
VSGTGGFNRGWLPAPEREQPPTWHVRGLQSSSDR